MPPTSLEAPALLRQAAGTRLQLYGEHEFDLTQQIRDSYREPLTSYREMLQAYFLSRFGDNLAPPKRLADGTIDPTWTPEATWDLARAARLGTLDELTGSFDDLIDAIHDPLDDLFDEELADGYEESYDLGLWSLYLGGIDSTKADPPPDRSRIKRVLMAAGIAGLGYPQRLGAWGADVKGRYRSRMRGLIASGATGMETLDAFDQVTQTYVGRVEGLGQNELFRAYSVGAADAVAPYKQDLEGEVWLTREDGAVCPICAAKHLTITDDQPIANSHPGCRCRKVPIPLNYNAQPIDYVGFLQKLGRR